MKRKYSGLLEIIDGSRTGLLAAGVRLLLRLLSSVYRVAIQVRNWSFDRQLRKTCRVPARVISTGNLTVGGTGKTPFVIWLAEHLADHHPVAIVSRGYGRGDELLNDEGLEIGQRLPHVIQVQNPDRVKAAHAALDLIRNRLGKTACVDSVVDGTPVILLDDGFQHRRLGRDLDIVLIDATNPFGYGHLLPRGLLREPVSSISRADIAVLTRTNLVDAETRKQIRERLAKLNPELTFLETCLAADGWLGIDGSVHPLEKLDDNRVFAFCGIGNPDAFFSTLDGQSLTVAATAVFPDHHRYSPDDTERIERQARELRCDVIACTRKDMVKLTGPAGSHAFSMPVLALSTSVQPGFGAAEFWQRVQGECDVPHNQALIQRGVDG